LEKSNFRETQAWLLAVRDMKDVDLKDWLTKHSTNVQELDGELRFTHFRGDTSILLPRVKWRDNLLLPRCAALRSFYDQYFGASIGDSQIIIATNVEGGIEISHGFRIPDLGQMKNSAIEVGMPLTADQEVFMVEAGWMFIYAYDFSTPDASLFYYDRDFKKTHKVDGFEKVLDEWWKMVIDNTLR
jgi:hypothetical protein